MPDKTLPTPDPARNLPELLPQDALRQILLSALTQLMESEVSALCAASHGSRSDDRLNSRNGYRERDLETRMGTLPLAIPRVRKGSYLPSFLEPRRRWEQAFVNVVSEAYLLGVSTRKVEELVEAMGAKGMSKSEVSRMAASLDAQVAAFRNRRLDKPYPYLWLDALYIKVREDSKVLSKAVLIATGVSESGEREIVGVNVASGEMEPCWSDFLRSLQMRGLTKVKLVISDAHSGLRRAIQTTLLGATWQRCMVHFLRNVLVLVPKAHQRLTASLFRMAFDQTNRKDAREFYGRALEMLRNKFPKAAQCAEDAEEDVMAYLSFPQTHWKQVRSTNPLERLNKEIRRRTDVVGIFPNDASLLRLVTMLLVEQQEEWSVGRRYFSLESMQGLKENAAEPELHLAVA